MHTVIIIGAGAAGLAAASSLLRFGINDIVVLEAEDRFGGRVRSVRFGRAIVEIGAEWCHGDSNNAVFDLVQNPDLLGSTDPHMKMHLSDGNPIEDTFARELQLLFDDIYTPDGNRDQPEGATVGDYFIQAYTSAIAARYGNDKDKNRVAALALETFQRNVLTSEGAFSWHHTSAANDYRDCPGDLLINWKGHGYNVIFDKFNDETPNKNLYDKILMNKKVVNINWNTSDGATIRCSDGSTYHSSIVLMTCSIGVLKADRSELFTPLLPFNKQMAIDRIGFAGVHKIMMLFELPFWSSDFNGSLFVWTEEDRKKFSSEMQSNRDNKYSWLLDCMGVMTVENNPNVLSCWFTGPSVPQIERLEETILMEGLMLVLKTFLGKQYLVSEPTSIARFNWFTNPNFRGAYSYQTVASRQCLQSSHSILAEPLYSQDGKPLVCFAGEATHNIYYSSVHGAIESGYREAHRIQDYIKCPKLNCKQIVKFVT